eukprot:TRINITY_DN8603_c0_g1_i8.p1 TRINITY_DN8603_c0_g1~~TRINITY_DN8603_c0_g1_i8.p1  ORF type:complete len:356 (-),score=94.93 TRINITY_DN8603_c0_g1_i8:197-1264(-)
MDKRFRCAESEWAYYQREHEAMLRDLHDAQNHSKYDTELRNQLRQSHQKTKEEKTAWIEGKLKTLLKEIEQLKLKLEQKKSERPDIEAMKEMVKKIILLKEQVDLERDEVNKNKETIADLKQRLQELSQTPGNVQLSNSIALKNECCKRTSVSIEEKEKEIDSLRKQDNKLLEQIKDIQLLINMCHNRGGQQECEKAEILAEERMLQLHIQDLKQKIEDTMKDISGRKVIKTAKVPPEIIERQLTEIDKEKKQAQEEIQRLKAQLDTLKADLRLTEKEGEEVLGEISLIESEFLLIQAQNIDLVNHLAESEETNLNLIRDCTRQTNVITYYLFLSFSSLIPIPPAWWWRQVNYIW